MRLLGVVTAGALALVLGACGGGGTKTVTETIGDASTPAATAATPAATETATAEATTPAEDDTAAGGGSDGKTAPGTTLKVGQTAHVDIKPLNASLDSKKTFPIDVTVEKNEKGSIDDFKNIDLDAKQKKSTPYYVTVKITAKSNFPVKDDDPDIRVEGIDDRDQEQGSVTFFGTFDRCDDKEAPNPFKPGTSYESCLTFLVPGGGAIKEAHWTGSDKYVLKPVAWK